MSHKSIYFASDVHLGAPYIADKIAHEKRFTAWLDSIIDDCGALYLVGDIFDFWWEYKRVVPRGFTRTLGRLSAFTDRGIPVHFFTGNHDIWVFDYLETECGITVHRHAHSIELNGKSFFIAHGDEFASHDKLYLFMRSCFHNKILQWLFQNLLHPDFSLGLALGWSNDSRKNNARNHAPEYRGEADEFLVKFAKSDLKNNETDFYIFGHRHIALDLMLNRSSRIIILGDWLTHFTFGKFCQGEFTLETFENK